MKSRREHRVPLSTRALELLRLAGSMSAGSDLIFPGKNYSKQLSNMIFTMALRRMSIEATTHGFRSTFRDWAAEETNCPAEVCEMALDLPLNFHPAAFRASTNVTPFGAVSVPA